jgi:hypothetical protein
LDRTFFDVTNILLQTTGKDLNELIPQTQTENIAWNDLENITFSGSYSGQVDEFNARGNLSSTLGDALLDLNMNFKTAQPSYAGRLETNSFDIGKLIRQSSIGKISMNGNIDGSGFDLDHLNAKIDAVVSKIEIDSNTYVDLTINGLVSNRKFDGIFISQDPGLTVNFNGKVDISGKEPVYQFNSRFIRFDLKKLGLTTESIIGSGYAKLNFSGSTIDNFTGTALFQNLILEKDKKEISLKDIVLESYQTTKDKTLKLTSSLADASINGNFIISELPNAIQLYLYHYLPQYIQKPNTFSNQQLTYAVTIHDVTNVLATFLPDYHGLSGSVISGELNSWAQKFSLDANITSFGYQQLQVNNLTLVGAGDYTEFDLNVNSGPFIYGDEVIIPSFQLNGIMASDTANLSIVTQSKNELLGDAYINISAALPSTTIYTLRVLPSNISIKEDKWQVYGNREIVSVSDIQINDLVLENGAQKITLNTKNQGSMIFK